MYFQVRTLFNPLTWPVFEPAGNLLFSDSSEASSNSQADSVNGHPMEPHFHPAAKTLSSIPTPPVPRLLQTTAPIIDVVDSEGILSTGETLNPDVPEFVPTVFVKTQKLETIPAEVEVGEEEKEKEIEEKKVKKEIPKNETTVTFAENIEEIKKEATADPPLTNGEVETPTDHAWKEVR